MDIDFGNIYIILDSKSRKRVFGKLKSITYKQDVYKSPPFIGNGIMHRMPSTPTDDIIELFIDINSYNLEIFTKHGPMRIEIYMKEEAYSCWLINRWDIFTENMDIDLVNNNLEKNYTVYMELNNRTKLEVNKYNKYNRKKKIEKLKELIKKEENNNV